MRGLGWGRTTGGGRDGHENCMRGGKMRQASLWEDRR